MSHTEPLMSSVVNGRRHSGGAVIACGVVLGAFEPAWAQEETRPSSCSGSMWALTEYVDRGISQSHGGGVAQGALQWALPAGGYAALWGSNVDFHDGDEATVELNYILGAQREWGESLVGVSVAYIHYPAAARELEYDIMEFSASIDRAFGTVDLRAEGIFTPENSGKAGEAFYAALGAGRQFTEAVTLTVHAGRQWHERKDHRRA